MILNYFQNSVHPYGDSKKKKFSYWVVSYFLCFNGIDLTTGVTHPDLIKRLSIFLSLPLVSQCIHIAQCRVLLSFIQAELRGEQSVVVEMC